MVQALTDLRSWLGELGATEVRLLQSGAIVLVLLTLRWILLAIVRRHTTDARAQYIWRKGITYTATVVGILLVGRVWFEAFGSVATFFGLIGAGLVVALKDPLANLAGWVFILWRRPFRIGDRVQIADQAGDVIDIRLFQFTLLEIGNWVDADQSTGRLLHVPNGRIFTEPTANYTAGVPFIWDELAVRVTFESNWRAAKEILQDVAVRRTGAFAADAEREFRAASRQHLIFYSTLQPAVYTSVRESGVLLTIRYVCDARQRRPVAAAIWEDTLMEFERRPDIDFAYPTTRFFERTRDGTSELQARAFDRQ